MQTREQRLEYNRHYWRRNKRRILRRRREAGWKQRENFAVLFQGMDASEAKFLSFLMQQLFAMLTTPSILEIGAELLLITMRGSGVYTSMIERRLGVWSTKLITTGQSNGNGQSTSRTPKGTGQRNMRAAREAMGGVTKLRYIYTWKSKSGQRLKDPASCIRNPIIGMVTSSIAGAKIYSGRHQRLMYAIEPVCA